MTDDQEGSLGLRIHRQKSKPLWQRKKARALASISRFWNISVGGRSCEEALTSGGLRGKFIPAMKFRTYKNTDLTVSEVGFGLWTISTGWWGNFTDGEAIPLLHKAVDQGINLFDAADTYGNGRSE